MFRGCCCCKVFMICASVSRNLLPVRTFQVNFPMTKADFLLILCPELLNAMVELFCILAVQYSGLLIFCLFVVI